MADPVAEFLEYVECFIEKPNQSFNGFPVCPFAKKARIKQTIQFHLSNFTIEDEDQILAALKEFDQKKYEVFVLLSTDKDKISVSDLYKLASKLQEKLTELTVFTGHPEDNFQIRGTSTRQDPYPNLQFIPNELLVKSRLSLYGSKYYNF